MTLLNCEVGDEVKLVSSSSGLPVKSIRLTLLILKYCFLVIFRWLLVYICNLLSWSSYVECKQRCFNFKQEGVAVMSAAAKTDKLKQCQCKLNKP